MIRPAPLLLLMAGLTATFVFSTAAAASSKTSSSSAAAAPLPSPSTATVSNGSPTPATSAAATDVSSNNINRPKAMAPQTIATTVNTAVTLDPFTAENGATRIVPHSKDWADELDQELVEPELASEGLGR